MPRKYAARMTIADLNKCVLKPFKNVYWTVQSSYSLSFDHGNGNFNLSVSTYLNAKVSSYFACYFVWS